MRSLLIFLVVCASLTFGKPAESDLAKELVRSLSNYVRSEGNQQQSQGQTAVGGDQPVDKLTPAKFRGMLREWAKLSKEYIEQVQRLRPKLFMLLTGAIKFEHISDEFDSMLKGGENIFWNIMKQALDVLRLAYGIEVPEHSGIVRYFTTEGFKPSGKCARLQKLVEDFEIKDEAEDGVRNIEAMVADMDCMTGDMEDVLGALDNDCSVGDKMSFDDVSRILNDVTRYLERAATDGTMFAKAAETAGHAWYNFKIQQNNEVGSPATRELHTLLSSLVRNLKKQN